MSWFKVREKTADAQARKAECQGEKVLTSEGVRRCNATDMVVKHADDTLSVMSAEAFEAKYDTL